MTIEVTAKKVDDAINQGLKQLGAELDDVKVEVLESGGIFRKAKVRLTLETEAPQSEEKPDKPAAVGAKPNDALAPEKPVKNENSEKPVKADKKPQAEKAEKSEKSDRVEKAEKAEKANKVKSAEEKDGAKPKTPNVDVKKKVEKTGGKPPRDTEEKSAAAEKAPVKSESRARKLDADDRAAAERALEFVKQALVKMGFEGATVEADANDAEYIKITAPTGDDSLIIGRHGETLSALSYLAETGARAEKCHINVTVDCNGYRERRAASLTAMAKRRANECASKCRKIKLEPMERVDRRTVHNALTGDDRVITASEGKEPYRYVVILPKGKQNAQRRDGGQQARPVVGEDAPPVENAEELAD